MSGDRLPAALVLVDYQQRLLPSLASPDSVLAEALCLADAARLFGIAVVGTEQNSERLGPNVEPIRQRCASTLSKMHFDACAEGLEDLLVGLSTVARPAVVLAGCESHVCLLQTGLGLLAAGCRLQVVAGACGARSICDHDLAMQRLRQAGAVIVSTEMVVFEWLGHCRHEHFREVLGLVKELRLRSGPN